MKISELQGKTVVSATEDSETSDVVIDFGGGLGLKFNAENDEVTDLDGEQLETDSGEDD